MEFPGITVGGDYAGSAGESSSFKHGYFDHSVRPVEVVLANGDIMTASGSENVVLFKGSARVFSNFGNYNEARK